MCVSCTVWWLTVYRGVYECIGVYMYIVYTIYYILYTIYYILYSREGELYFVVLRL